MAGYSLAERASMIKERYPGKSITGPQLRRLYLSRGVKRKVIRQEKVVPRHRQWERDAQRLHLIAKLDEWRALGRRVLYLDEVVFSKLSMPKL